MKNYDPTQTNLLFGGSLTPNNSFNPTQSNALYGGSQFSQPTTPAKPQKTYTAPKAPTPVAPIAPPVPKVQPIQINPTYSQYVQTRPSSVNQGVLEYYNPQNQMGFSTPQDVLNYIRTQTGQNLTTLDQLTASPTVSQPTQSPYDSFAQSAAQAGLSVEDYLKYVTGGVSGADRDKINQGLGIPDLYKQLFTPAPKTQELYNQAYDQAGLGNLKKKIEQKIAEVNRIQSAYTGKGTEINENPFLSDASRTGRLRVLEDKRLQEIGNLNNEVASMQDLYNNGLAEVNSVVTRTTQDFTNDQQVNALKLTYLQQQAEQQLSDLQSSRNQAAYQYLPDFLKAKALASKPNTLGSSETGYFQWNPNTGTFEQIIAPQTNPLDDAYKMAQIQKIQQELATGGMNDIDRQYKLAQLQKLQQEIAQPNIAKQQALSSNLQVVNALLTNPNISQISGFIQGKLKLGNLLPSAQLAINQFNQLKGILSLDNREKLKGSGAISDFEARILEQAASALDRNLSDSEFKKQLQSIKEVFEGKYNQTGSSGGSDPLGLFSGFNSAGNASASTPYLKTLGVVTGENGSSLWSYGLDVDLKKGDPVKSPVMGTVIAAAPNGGFGNQVKIRTQDGKEIWLSHLDSGVVKVGQTVQPGQVIGYGGNSGNTIALSGGDGSHLDITIKDNGKLYTAPQVKSYLQNIYV